MIVVWRITERCNLACPFCAYDRTLPRGRRTMDATAARGIVARLAEYQETTGDPVLLSWLGGEPLLWPEFEDLSREAVARGLRLSVTTNGTLLTRPAIRTLLGTLFAEVTVSVDGLAPTHDRLRGWPGGFDVLAKSVRALADEKRQRGQGPKLRVNTVLMHSTWREFSALCEAVADWGVEEITFNQLGGNDRPEFYPAHRLTPEDVEGWAAALPGVRERARGRGLEVVGGDAYLRRLRATSRGLALPVEDCGPGERFWFIDERGRVAPCSFTVEGYGVPLADLASVEAWRELPERFSQARARRRLASCADCHSTQVCEKFAARRAESGVSGAGLTPEQAVPFPSVMVEPCPAG
ncbi:MAG: radical SAM protein [Opitutaceae bacterium]|nr:radical SAM protein [Opitutaceae bacterium]